jgi:Protein of unknown function, DUF481
MTKTIPALLLIMVGFVPVTNAQLTDTARVQYRVAVSGNVANGNIERIILNNEVSFGYVGNAWGLSSRNTYFYFENAARKLDSDFLSRNFIYLRPKQKLYPYLMAWYESNYRRKIDYRYQLGVGVSYVLAAKAANRVKASVTLTNEETGFVGPAFEGNPDPANRKINLYRYTLRLMGSHTLPTHTKISYELWGQNAFRTQPDPRLYGELTLDFPIAKRLSFRTTALYAFEKKVYSQVKQEDFTLLFGVTYGHK